VLYRTLVLAYMIGCRSAARDVRSWHFSDKQTVALKGRYWDNNGQRSARRLKRYAANDPTATLAVHCGNVFDAGFGPYQSGRLNRYDAVF
jgi:hypothetical protein